MTTVKEKAPDIVKDLLKEIPANLTSGKAEVRLIDHKRTGIIGIREYFDPITGQLRRLVDQFGKDRVVKISRNKNYDLANTNDRLEYWHIMNHPVYVLGPRPVLLAINHEEEAADFVLKQDLIADANTIVRKLTGEQLRDFSRVMLVGKKVTTDERTSEAVLKRALYEIMEEDPKRLLDEWNDPDRGLKELLRKGLDRKVFSQKNDVYAFGTERMGISFDQAIEWLKSNDDILPQIRKEINSNK